MSETVEFEINKQFKNYIVIVKTMSKNREKGFYNVYGKDALVFSYIMKLKIRYRNFYIAKIFKKNHYFSRESGKEQKRQRVYTAYTSVPLYKFQEIINILNFYRVNYIIIDKMQNYQIINTGQFNDNNYEVYYKKGIFYKRVLNKIKNITEFIKVNSDSGEIMYLIYDIERCIDDYCKRNKNLKDKKLENKDET